MKKRDFIEEGERHYPGVGAPGANYIASKKGTTLEWGLREPIR